MKTLVIIYVVGFIMSLFVVLHKSNSKENCYVIEKKFTVKNKPGNYLYGTTITMDTVEYYLETKNCSTLKPTKFRVNHQIYFTKSKGDTLKL